MCRLVGLLHDLTHAPFGHTVEDEIHIVASKHDHPQRQADAFYRLICQLLVWLARDAGWPDSLAVKTPGEIPDDISQYADDVVTKAPRSEDVATFAVALVTKTRTEVYAAAWRIDLESLYELLANLHGAMTALLHLELLQSSAVSAEMIPASSYPFQHVIERTLADLGQAKRLDDRRFVPHRDAYMLDVVGNTVCADLLDYAQRDAHFTGLRLDYDEDRIAENFTLVAFDTDVYSFAVGEAPRTLPLNANDPFRGRCLRTAISLFSHKFRSDVPGELMNLLNARFHLYERAIYHPTKCAAGAMLGTALQLIGWRRSLENPDPLPSELQNVGDAVFLQNASAAAADALSYLRHYEQDDGSIEVTSAFAQSLIATPRDTQEAVAELTAGRDLLRRLGSRRYYRQVYRALPNSKHAELQVGPETLADVFKNAERRYLAERDIERQAGMRVGSVVIHCPKLTTATKVANVLLVLREDDAKAIDRVHKLCHISRFGSDLFGKHEDAVAAVTAMYKSMWRLGVYVSPEYTGEYKRVGRVAGKVIADAVARHINHERQPTPWPNDPQLEMELTRKFAAASTGGQADGRIAEVSFSSLGELRAHKILESARPFLRKTSQSERDQFVTTFGASLASLQDDGFAEIDLIIQEQSRKTDFANASDVHGRGSKLNRVAARLREALQRQGISVDPW